MNTLYTTWYIYKQEYIIDKAEVHFGPVSQRNPGPCSTSQKKC